MMPSSSSSVSIWRFPLRAASRAASLTRFERSAPVKPGVWPASASMSISRASGLPRVWTSRIRPRPLRSGRSTTIWRAKRPGRSSAGARMSGRVVAAVRVVLSFISKPAISARSWFSVWSRSSWPPPRPGAAVAADGVDLVHEDDARGVLLGLLEEVADARGADADEHLDEVGARDREERHAGLARDGAGQQRLTCARRAVEQYALGDPGP